MTSLPRVRDDSLPEGVDYFSEKYDGCEYSVTCLNCPLPECRFDNPLEFKAESFARRNAMIWRWRTEVGMSVLEISRQLKLAKRTVFGILAKGPHEMDPLDEVEWSQTSSETAGVAPRAAQRKTAPSRVVYESV